MHLNIDIGVIWVPFKLFWGHPGVKSPSLKFKILVFLRLGEEFVGWQQIQGSSAHVNNMHVHL